jgi:hypothetical protein
MAVFSPTNAKVHFKAYDGNFTDALGNVTVHQHNSVSMSTAETIFGQKSMYMSDFNQAVSFTPDSTFDVGTGDYTVGMWFYPTQFTSYDRLFVTDPYENASPLRIYNHNGHIQVYVETVDGDNTHDLILSHYLGNAASAENQWVHIMVHRDSGTTKLYINGAEQDSTTDSYTITSSNTIVLGSDTDRGATGVKGYIADFFWTEDAVSFAQADFTPGTAEPITFHSGNPSISSFSSGGVTSVDNVGDTVTLTWSTSGETKLELLKYIGGILSSTEDVLGLSSKTVIITQTVSYKLRTTNDNGVVDSSFLNISLGGSEMAIVNALSGSEPAQSMQVNVNLLGGVSYDNATGRVAGLAVGAAGSGGRTAVNALSASFGRTETVIEALNHLKAGAASIAPRGPTGSIQLRGTGDTFNAYPSLTVNSAGLANFPKAVTLGSAATDITTVTGKLTASNGISVTGIGAFSSDVTVGDQLTVTGPVVANGAVTLGNAAGDITTVTGKLTASNGISVTGIAELGSKLDVAGDVTLGAAATNVTTVTGKLTASNGISVSGIGAFSSDVTVGDLLTVNGSATLGNAVGDVTTVTGKLTASNGIQVNGIGAFSSDLVVGDALTVTGDTALNGGVSLGDAAGDTIGVAGTMTVATPFTASKDVSVGQKLLAAKGIILTGSLTHGSDKFGDLPKLQIQGTNAIGRFQDYHLAVSGGILRAIQL